MFWKQCKQVLWSFTNIGDRQGTYLFDTDRKPDLRDCTLYVSRQRGKVNWLTHRGGHGTEPSSTRRQEDLRR